MKMKSSCLIALLLCSNSINSIHAQQQNSGSTSATSASAITTTSFSSDNNATPTAAPTPAPSLSESIRATSNSSTATASTNSNSTTTGTIPFFSPSPTSFVFTHFPVLPFHTAIIGSSSSMMSSARPSQSAPFPDDTIGKYGRLHISKATQSYEIISLHHLSMILLLSSFFMFS